MFTGSLNQSLKKNPDREIVFLYCEELGECPFFDIDVKHEAKDDKGQLIEIQYLGWPLEISEEQAADWRRVLKRFYEVKREHYSGSINNWGDVESMAEKNSECFKACEEFARIQREMIQESNASWVKRSPN
jgi:hypothetical protein